MSETTRKRIMYGVLAAALVWGASNIDLGPREPKNPPAARSVTEGGAAETPARPQKQAIRIAEYEDVEWGSDPFRVVKRPPATAD